MHQTHRFAIIPWGCIGLVEGIGNLATDLYRSLGENLLFMLVQRIDHRTQRGPMDVLHDDRLFFFEVIEHPDHTAVFDLVEQGELLNQALNRFGIARIPQLFDGDDAPPGGLAATTGNLTHGEVNGAILARSQLFDHLIMADVLCQRSRLARGKRVPQRSLTPRTPLRGGASAASPPENVRHRPHNRRVKLWVGAARAIW
jgi:hypothetical protein